MPVQLFKPDFMNMRETAGKLVPWSDAKLPIDKPLVASGNGIYALKSGGRGALIGDGRKWHKLKGCRPEEGRAYETTTGKKKPFGGVTKDDSLNELEVAAKLADAYAGHGVDPPMLPAGHIEYGMSFDGGPICCTVLEVSCDTRFNTVASAWARKVRQREDVEKALRAVLKGSAEWMAFSHNMLTEAGVTPSEYSFSAENFSFHRVKGGYGLARIDLNDADQRLDEGKMHLKMEIDMVMLTEPPAGGFLKKYAKSHGIDYNKLIWNIEDGGKVRMVPSRGGEERMAVDGEIRYLHVDNIPWKNSVVEAYLGILDEPRTPEPIPAAAMRALYGRA